MDINTVTEFVPAPGVAWRDGDAWLGGGTWLFSQLQPGVRRLLDLDAFAWPPLTETADDLEIAATCTLAELRSWVPVHRDWAAASLARLCCDALLGSFKVQHMATVGGNICLSLAAGPMISLASSLDGVATLVALDGTVREVAVADFVTGDGSNVLAPGELLRKVAIPASSLRCKAAFRQVSLSQVGRSAVLVIARCPLDAGTDARETVVTVTAATPHPLQLRFQGPQSPESAVAALDAARPSYLGDGQGSRLWREAMTRRCVAETVAELVGLLPFAAFNSWRS